MQRRIGIWIASIAIGAGAGTIAWADTTPEDAKDYRSAIMTAIRGHLVASSMIARGLVDDNGQLVDHANALVATTNELDSIFQEGSNVGESEALPAIWEQPEAFAKAIDDMQAAAAAFAAAAESGDGEAVGAAFRNVGMGCRGCHDNFRAQD